MIHWILTHPGLATIVAFFLLVNLMLIFGKVPPWDDDDDDRKL